MSEFSDDLEAKIINHFFRNTSQTSPTTVYLALYTAAPSDAGGGTEVSGGSYARQSIAFAAPSGGVSSNSALVSFTASGASWGTITHVGIFDAVSAGNLMMWSPIDTNRTVNDGDTLEFAASSVSITVT